jgi:hypothetical protein
LPTIDFRNTPPLLRRIYSETIDCFDAEILHEHRFLGNKAVHELSQPSIEELKFSD